MNTINQTNCNNCQVYDWCFLICCRTTHLCRDCVLDCNVLDEYYQCGNCDRPLGRLYRSICDQAQEMTIAMGIAGHGSFGGYPNNTRQFHRNNSFTGFNYQQTHPQEQFNFVNNSRPQQQLNTRINNQFINMQPNNFTANQPQITNFQLQQQEIRRRNLYQQNQQGGSGNNVGLWNSNNMMNNSNRNNFLINQQQFSNMNNNIQSQSQFQQHLNTNTLNMNQQQEQINQRSHSSKSFTTNIRRNKQQTTMNQLTIQQNHQQHEEDFFFQDEIERKQQQHLHQNQFVARNTGGTNFNFANNQSSGNNNTFTNVNPNNFNSNRANKNIHFNNFQQRTPNQNGEIHTFDQQNDFFFNDQRTVKSAQKNRKNDFSPNNAKRNNFNNFQHTNQNMLIDLKNKGSEKDLSPTFGDQNDGENFEFEGSMIAEEKPGTRSKLKKSDSSYTLGDF